MSLDATLSKNIYVVNNYFYLIFSGLCLQTGAQLPLLKTLLKLNQLHKIFG